MLIQFDFLTAEFAEANLFPIRMENELNELNASYADFTI